MSKYGYDDTRRTRFRRLLLGMGVAMLLFFLLLKIFFAEQLPFTSLHWKLIFGYFLLLSVAVLVYPAFRKMRDQDRWSIQNGAIEIEEGVLHLSVVRGRETRRLNVEIKNLKIVTSDDVRIRIDTPVGQLTISADNPPLRRSMRAQRMWWLLPAGVGVIHRLEGLLNRYLFLGLSSKYLAEPFFCFIFAVTKAEYSHRINDISRDGAVGSSSGS